MVMKNLKANGFEKSQGLVSFKNDRRMFEVYMDRFKCFNNRYYFLLPSTTLLTRVSMKFQHGHFKTEEGDSLVLNICLIKTISRS